MKAWLFTFALVDVQWGVLFHQGQAMGQDRD